MILVKQISLDTFLPRYIVLILGAFNFVLASPNDVHVQVDFLPWMPDYKNVWTNERLCDYFGITTDEWQEMEKFMSLYK